MFTQVRSSSKTMFSLSSGLMLSHMDLQSEKKKMQATSQNALWDPWDVADLEEKLQVSGGT